MKFFKNPFGRKNKVIVTHTEGLIQNVKGLTKPKEITTARLKLVTFMLNTAIEAGKKPANRAQQEMGKFAKLVKESGSEDLQMSFFNLKRLDNLRAEERGSGQVDQIALNETLEKVRMHRQTYIANQVDARFVDLLIKPKEMTKEAHEYFLNPPKK